MGIGAAILGAGAASAIGGAISSGNQASAAKSAADTQAQAAEDALAQQKATTAQVLGIEQPFVNVGTDAIPSLDALLGITPGAGGTSGAAGNAITGGASINPTAMTDALAKTPGYQFALQQGLMATQNGFAAQGLARSGSAMKGAAQYAEGLAGTQYQNILNNYYNTVSLGSNAASNFGAAALGGQAAANQLITGAGQATASGIIGAANATSAGINSITGSLGNAATTLALTGGGGLFGGGSSSIPSNALTFAGSNALF